MPSETLRVCFAKLDPKAVIPSKREEDAGYDIYACFAEDYLCLAPHETRAVPTGIASACPVGYYFQVQERGSTGTKGIAQRCGVIDSGYRGEWFLPVTNTTVYPLYIAKPETRPHFEEKAKSERFTVYYTDKALAQAILLQLPAAEVETLSYEALCAIPSLRGSGKQGSTSK